VVSTFANYAASQRRSRADLEARIGGNWFNRIGVLAIVIGVGFFFKTAYDRDWIKPEGWVAIGLAAGIAFLLGGAKTRRKYESYAYGLIACGISILYLSIFAAFHLWQLVGQPVAFVSMAAVTATAALLSARYNALPIALLGLIGGFITPILLSTGHDNQRGLFGYITLLDLGILALAYSKQWRSLNYLAFCGTVAMLIGWSSYYTPEKLWTTVFFLTVFFVIFALLAVLYNVVHRRPTNWLDLGLVFANALLYFGSTYALLENRYHQLLGAFAILVAAFYMVLGYVTYSRDREDSLLVHTFLGLGFLFSVLAVPIQFDQHWVTMAWAIEGAVMTWVGLRARDRTSRYFGLVVFAIAATHWFMVDVHDFAFQAGGSFVPLLNQRALSCAVLVASLAAAAVLYRRYRDSAEEQERSMLASLYVLGANAAAVALLSLDANDYFARSRGTSDWPNNDVWNNRREFTLSAVWTIYGVMTLVVGILRNQKVVRALAGVLLAAATMKVLTVDLAYHQADWHLTLFNETFASIAMLVFGFGTAAWLYSRSEVPAGERRVFVPALILIANVLALIALTSEPVGYFAREAAEATGAGQSTHELAILKNSLHFTLTAIWTAYATVAMAIGFRRGSKQVRIGALALFGLAIAKLLVVDAAFFRAGWHVLIVNRTFGSFAVVVAALALTSLLYAKSRKVGEGERDTVAPLVIGVANILAVAGLSLEAIGYFHRAQFVSGVAADSFPKLENWKHFTLTAIWAVYASAAVAVALRRKLASLRIGAVLLLGLGCVKVLFYDAGYYDAAWHQTGINPTFAGFLLLIAALSFTAFVYSRAEEADHDSEMMVPLVLAAANLLAVIALSLEAIGYYSRGIHNEPASTEQLRNSMQFALTAVWTVYAGVAFVIGARRNSKGARWGALLLLGLAVAKVILRDARYYDAEWHRLILNPSFGAFALVIGGMSLAVFCYSHYDKIDAAERLRVVPLLIAIANLLAILALSAEAFGHYAVQLRIAGISPAEEHDLRLAQQLSLSVIWTVYGGALLTVGIWRRNTMLRIMALVLLSVTIVKVFLIDLSSLDKIYRTISFIVLGLILVAVSYLYQRYRQRTSGPEAEIGGE
jgi:uncharacterized membrane protein